MKKLILSFATVIAFAFYAVLSRSPVFAPVKEPFDLAETGAPADPTLVQPVSGGLYRDGEYMGSAENAYYGIVQIKAIVSAGKLSDVQFLSYPTDRAHSRELSARAAPLLAQEAIAAQRAEVDAVSGATETSAAFVRSLANALSQAK